MEKKTDYRGAPALAAKLEAKLSRVRKRYEFYEMKNQARDLGISTPPQLAGFGGVLGWCAKAVDSLADRLQFIGFRDVGDPRIGAGGAEGYSAGAYNGAAAGGYNGAGGVGGAEGSSGGGFGGGAGELEDFYGVNEIFRLNNPDVLFDAAILGALISSCAFVYVSPDDDGFPRLQVIDGGNATGVIDPITGLLTEGYAVLRRDKDGAAELSAWFTREKTVLFEGGAAVRVLPHKAGTPLLVPVIYRPDAVRPFGHSRISRACMDIVSSAMRTVKRSEIAAEFYSFPQRYAINLDNGMELDKWKAAMSALFTLSKSDDPDAPEPKLGQFPQASMAPHLEQLKLFAGLFAGETGLTMDDMGFPGVNPSGAESIQASHETLRLAARKAQRDFGSAFLNVGYTAACLRDSNAYFRGAFAERLRPRWAPIFEPDAGALGGIGDAVLKIQQAFPDYFDADKLREMTGI